MPPRRAVRARRPLVGVGVMVLKDGKVLLARRRGSHGAGEFAFPGGHLEHGESFAACARREVREECGIKIANIRFQFVANVTSYLPKHYVHVGLIADWASGVPRRCEPDKSGPWRWYDLDALPAPMFPLCELAFENLQSGRSFLDAVGV